MARPQPVAKPAQSAEPEEQPQEEAQDRSLKAMIRNMPSWLVSAVVHLAAILVMAMIMVDLTSEKPPVAIIGNTVEDVKPIEEVEIEPMQELQEVSIQTANLDAGAVDFGALPTANIVSEVGVASVEDSQIGEIGALFGSEGKGLAATGPGTGGAEFFGVKSTGDRFCFVVDGSNSMGQGTKWPECKRELMAAIRRLYNHQFFYVFLFSGKTHYMFNMNDTGEGLVRATPENIDKLNQWLESYNLQGGTVPKQGMIDSLEKLKPDAIYLLTDGQFTDNGDSERYILNFISQGKQFLDYLTGDEYNVVVHCIGFQSKSGEVVLKRISDAYKGTYRFVPAN